MNVLYVVMLLFLGISARGVGTEVEDIVDENSSLMAQAKSEDDGNMKMQSGCEKLPADQKKFAMQLKASNREMFCNMFNVQQRKNAMQMVGKRGANGIAMTADQAVEQVAQMNKMAPSPSHPTQPMGMTQGGGCPVRSN